MSESQTTRQVCAEERWNVLDPSVECLEIQLPQVLTDDFNVLFFGEGECRDGKELPTGSVAIREHWERARLPISDVCCML
jgi:hypothetical protein